MGLDRRGGFSFIQKHPPYRAADLCPYFLIIFYKVCSPTPWPFCEIIEGYCALAHPCREDTALLCTLLLRVSPIPISPFYET